MSLSIPDKLRHCPCGKPRLLRHCGSHSCPWAICTEHIYDGKGRMVKR